ncbi:MAG: mechanosensitive ion channel family protein [Lachnospiraceae bacterium]|nr:mechanosensitive ion channel family protein [Lachnospiraceae bacterium]
MTEKKVIGLLIVIAGAVVALILTGIIYKRVVKKNNNLHTRFLVQMLRFIIVVGAIINGVGVVSDTMSLGTLFFRSSALIVAILGFAAQPVIADLISGYLISLNKPFEIGDRIEVEGQEPGTVEDITLRHTVIHIYDGIRLVIPNSLMNSKVIKNTSYKMDRRCLHLEYFVSYDTDVQKAMDVIRDCVVACPYTLDVERNGIREDSGPVYFTRFGDSALILETTVFISRTTESHIAKTDMNVRVHKAFAAHGIEIPYNFVNVVEREYVENEVVEDKGTAKNEPVKRTFRTDTYRLYDTKEPIARVITATEQFGSRLKLDQKYVMQLQLISEELIGIVRNIITDAKATFWIEGTGLLCRIHLLLPTSVESAEYQKLISLSTTGKNEAASNISGKIWQMTMNGLLQKKDGEGKKGRSYTWSLREYESTGDTSLLGESILSSMANDVKVKVTKASVELIVIKKMDKK